MNIERFKSEAALRNSSDMNFIINDIITDCKRNTDMQIKSNIDLLLSDEVLDNLLSDILKYHDKDETISFMVMAASNIVYFGSNVSLQHEFDLMVPIQYHESDIKINPVSTKNVYPLTKLFNEYEGSEEEFRKKVRSAIMDVNGWKNLPADRGNTFLFEVFEGKHIARMCEQCLADRSSEYGAHIVSSGNDYTSNTISRPNQFCEIGYVNIVNPIYR